MTCLKTVVDHLQTTKSQLFNPTFECCGPDVCQQIKCRKKSEAIPLARKICYAFGGVPYQITAVSMGISMQIFLLDVVQMEAFYVSMILFVSRAWDAVTDPLVGYLVSRSHWTPIGKLMPWVVLSMPFAILSYVLLWFMPQESMSQAFSVPWFLVTACMFETLMSCFNVPYLSMNMSLGGDQRDRDSATAYRMTVEILAMLLGSVVQGQVIAVYNAERDGACQQLDQTQPTPQSTTSPHAASLHGTAYDESYTEPAYESYDNYYSQPQAEPEYYDYGHGETTETYESYGQDDWNGSQRSAPGKALPPPRASKAPYREHPYRQY